MGFVSKGKTRGLLKKKQGGTFLLRFSESSRDGGITFSWVEYSNHGVPNVRSIQPFTSVDLKQIPFAEILRNFQIMEADNAPVCPLQFLYPDKPKDLAFGKYYNEKTGSESPYFKYIKTKLVFVSKENGCTNMAEEPMPDLCLQHNDTSPEMNEDLMLQGPENSPMLSSDTSDPVLLSEILESSLNGLPEESAGVHQHLFDLSQDVHADAALKNAPSVSEFFFNLIPEAFSPDPDFSELQEFPLDRSFQELGFHMSMPLTP